MTTVTLCITHIACHVGRHRMGVLSGAKTQLANDTTAWQLLQCLAYKRMCKDCVWQQTQRNQGARNFTSRFWGLQDHSNLLKPACLADTPPTCNHAWHIHEHWDIMYTVPGCLSCKGPSYSACCSHSLWPCHPGLGMRAGARLVSCHVREQIEAAAAAPAGNGGLEQPT